MRLNVRTHFLAKLAADVIVTEKTIDDAELALQQPELHEENDDRVGDNVRSARRVVIARCTVETADFGHMLPADKVEEPILDISEFGMVPDESVLAEKEELGFGTDLAVELKDLG